MASISCAAGRGVAALDALRERDLLRGREQRHAADLAQVRAHRVVLAVAHVDVDRRARREHLGSTSSGSTLLVLVDDVPRSRARRASSSLDGVVVVLRVERMWVGIVVVETIIESCGECYGASAVQAQKLLLLLSSDVVQLRAFA